MTRKYTTSQIALYGLTFMLLIDGISYTLILPLIPELFFNSHFGFKFHSDAMRSLLYSLCLAIYPMTQFLGVAFFGVLSDVCGRRLMILLGLALLSASYFLSVISIAFHSFTLFFISRACQGFFGGMYSVANALLCDLGVAEEQRMFNFRLSTLLTKLGTALGPGLAMLILIKPIFDNQIIAPFCATAVLCALNFWLIWLTLKNISDKHAENHAQIFSSFKLVHLLLSAQVLIKNKETCLLAVGFLLYQCGSNLFVNSISLYLTESFHYTAYQLSFFNVAMNAVVLLSVYIVRFIESAHDYLRQLRYIVLSTVVLLLSSLVAHQFNDVLFSEVLMQAWAVSVIFFVTTPIARLFFTTIFTDYVENDNAGAVMGALGQLTAFSYVVSSLLVGYTVTRHIVLLFAAGCFALTLGCIILQAKRKKCRSD